MKKKKQKAKDGDLDESESKIARLSLTRENEVNSKALRGSSDCAKEEDQQREHGRRTHRKRLVQYLLGREAVKKSWHTG